MHFTAKLLRLVDAFHKHGVPFNRLGPQSYSYAMRNGWVPLDERPIKTMHHHLVAIGKNELIAKSFFEMDPEWKDLGIWLAAAKAQGGCTYKQFRESRIKRSRGHGAIVYRRKPEDQVSFEDAFLAVMSGCEREKVPFLTITKYPPFFARTKSMQEARQSYKVEKGEIPLEVMDKVLCRYPKWERLVVSGGIYVILEKPAHREGFLDADYYFRNEVEEQIEGLISAAARYNKLYIGLKEGSEVTQTVFSGPADAALAYMNRLPRINSQDDRDIIGYGFFGNKAGVEHRDAFMRTWASLSRQNKDKNEVISWLRYILREYRK